MRGARYRVALRWAGRRSRLRPGGPSPVPAARSLGAPHRAGPHPIVDREPVPGGRARVFGAPHRAGPHPTVGQGTPISLRSPVARKRRVTAWPGGTPTLSARAGRARGARACPAAAVDSPSAGYRWVVPPARRRRGERSGPPRRRLMSAAAPAIATRGGGGSTSQCRPPRRSGRTGPEPHRPDPQGPNPREKASPRRAQECPARAKRRRRALAGRRARPRDKGRAGGKTSHRPPGVRSGRALRRGWTPPRTRAGPGGAAVLPPLSRPARAAAVAKAWA
ncbi:MAG: hypothetical protein JWL99_4781 [Streptomyces oryziradicis]|nr:hypothetical protein [Actinacidiphila oryziradicis]